MNRSTGEGAGRTHEAPADRQSPIIMGEAPSHAERARTLVHAVRRGTLCTIMPPPIGSTDRDGGNVAGYPYGSVVNFVLDAAGNPLLLTSALAEHTRNFKHDPRASLFIQETAEGANDALALGRVTLLGRVEAVADEEREEVSARYLEAHADARYYVDYRDFAFYRLRVEAIRYIGGFGRMSWVTAPDFAAAAPDPIAPIAAGVISHMNADHVEGMVRLCRHPAGLDAVESVEMKAVDRLGFEMTAQTPQGPRFVRLGFAAPVTTGDEVRKAMIALLAASRKATSVS